MRLSNLFTKTRKEVPTDETSRNARLLIQAGYIHKEMAGVYVYLPLGFKVLENIKQIVREEMNSLGAHEFIMTAIQRKELWEKTDRWDDNKVDIWFKSQLKNGTDIGLAWSHEEPITDMMRNYIASYRDLPAYVHQFQIKLRNELRAKSGIMRGREFVMNDMYSYSVSDAAHQTFYDAATQAYLRVFERVGLGDDTFLTFASGGAFTQFSHEFQTICDAGEDIVYLHRGKKLAINEEVMSNEVMLQLGVQREELEQVKTAEVGNIFSFGITKSEQLGLYFMDEAGNKKPVILGSYGIGITRLMGVIAEKFADDKGIIWPENIAPAKVYLAILDQSPEVISAADELYDTLKKHGVEVLYDDKNIRPGEKFSDADLLGIPYRVVVSEKTMKNNIYELKKRTEPEPIMVSAEEIIKTLAG